MEGTEVTKLKISDVVKRSGIPASTIRFYVREGLLPAPEKVNKKMAYYDETCIERLHAIQYLQEKRYFPLLLINNILRRMDEGFGLQEAASVEDAVFGSDGRAVNRPLDRTAFLAETGLSEEDLGKAEKIGVIVPYGDEQGKALYNEEDVMIGRDSVKKLLDYGLAVDELAFYVEFGKQIVEKEMLLRRKIVAGKSMQENIRITADISQGANLREYILRRHLQKQIRETIQRSLTKTRAKKTETPR